MATSLRSRKYWGKGRFVKKKSWNQEKSWEITDPSLKYCIACTYKFTYTHKCQQAIRIAGLFHGSAYVVHLPMVLVLVKHGHHKGFLTSFWIAAVRLQVNVHEIMEVEIDFYLHGEINCMYRSGNWIYQETGYISTTLLKPLLSGWV